MRSVATFLSVDVETASNEMGSICQLGLAWFNSGVLVETRGWLVRPQSRFNRANSRLHGITQSDVAQAVTWKELYPALAPCFLGANIVSHTLFDRRAIFNACCRSSVPMFSYKSWVDTCRLARKVWPEEGCYTLPSLAKRFDMLYTAHDACEDARVAGELYIRATCQERTL